MKTLKESLLDNIDGQIEDQTALWEDWIKENYKVDGELKFHNGVVDVDGSVEVKNYNLTELTNGKFKFGKVTKNFILNRCSNLTSLKGSPKEAQSFSCIGCYKLKDLKGAPKQLKGDFDCLDCAGLKTLKGAPKKVGEDFSCKNCINLKSLEGAPEYVEGNFDCDCCNNLISFKGAPKVVDGDFSAFACSSLQSFYGLNEIGGDLYVQECPNLDKSMETPYAANVKGNIIY